MRAIGRGGADGGGGHGSVRKRFPDEYGAEVDEYSTDFDFHHRAMSEGVKLRGRCVAVLYLHTKYHLSPLSGRANRRQEQENEDSDEDMRCSPGPPLVQEEVCDSNPLLTVRWS